MAIEQMAPELERIVSIDQEIEQLGDGFGLAEGPVWWKEGGYLLFSEIPSSSRMKWAPGEGLSVFRDQTNGGNGQTRDPQGRLVVCEHETRRVTRIDSDGSITVVANSYRGMRLNRPNDVAVRSDGSIYFTDPITMNVESETDLAGVYRVSPDLGTINLLVRDFVLPNGITLSTDESVLFVDDSRKRHIRAFDIDPATGLLALATDRVFFQMYGERPGSADGMKVDVEGHLYCTGPGGIWIFDSSAKHLGIIVTGRTTNIAWGDDDWRTLYYTTHHEFGRIRLKIPGVPLPRTA